MPLSSSLEARVTALERKVRQLSIDIDKFMARDLELLARLRGQSVWRALRRVEANHPYDEAASKYPCHGEDTLPVDMVAGVSSYATDQAVMGVVSVTTEEEEGDDERQEEGSVPSTVEKQREASPTDQRDDAGST